MRWGEFNIPTRDQVFGIVASRESPEFLRICNELQIKYAGYVSSSDKRDNTRSGSSCCRRNGCRLNDSDTCSGQAGVRYSICGEREIDDRGSRGVALRLIFQELNTGTAHNADQRSVFSITIVVKGKWSHR